MDLIESPSAMTSWARDQARAGKIIALVPTMGAFHEGHLCLMRHAAGLADRVVVSLFVNPLQFGPREDLARYPRNLPRDLELAAGAKVDLVFAPAVDAMYPQGSLTRVQVAELTDTLCGARRPGHFDGVTTVVAKLFNIVGPQVAVFGRKDLQQLAVIRRLTLDLNWAVEIIGHPIVREADGLAMSSRNIYLTPAGRCSALALHRVINFARQRAATGEADAAALTAEVRARLLMDPAVRVDYVSIVHQHRLVATPILTRDSVLALAVFIGTTRLIDNGLLLTEE
ncbi:MAG: pantoate--beta-alanine ligase [Deltaproteobacteria bacterium CG23_combo_of_CG06-09_8_20_14_all_60_8]|nr:MAG: pantoate--beta-alanine ligase [Desulfobacterales bacterium CG2_30_60_27]PIP43514.1 MAG: pantoate--beta-alanine ligase [Deltaproteobacteria bacterium CG23_combo_of_CG06-09_8_20_14_all_60_8]